MICSKPTDDRWRNRSRGTKIAGAVYKLWRENHVKGPSFARYMVDTVERVIAGGAHIARSPETVRDQLAERVDKLGVNYMMIAFNIGNKAHDDAMRSITSGEEVMPKLAAL